MWTLWDCHASALMVLGLLALAMRLCVLGRLLFDKGGYLTESLGFKVYRVYGLGFGLGFTVWV